ncbi:hypothetical protein [Flavobacterium sharifuzzamanii]|uniref:hypothetical protein n=1 Tax=Flavobacterium sharifuzzamanii TaxID=2211133 RepID=UPI000DACD4C7|nr:hypothetical protein [Flavobacterium sharifuzzamanii]KAF2080053.1 hypothetical protein DMA14_16650 [Flavobacterium sharifuzzamanii]
MEYNENQRGKITPEKALKMLTDEGMNVTLEEATEILSFLRILAEARVKHFLKDSESDQIVKDDQLDQNIHNPTKIRQKKKTLSRRNNLLQNL